MTPYMICCVKDQTFHTFTDGLPQGLGHWENNPTNVNDYILIVEYVTHVAMPSFITKHNQANNSGSRGSCHLGQTYHNFDTRKDDTAHNVSSFFAQTQFPARSNNFNNDDLFFVLVTTRSSMFRPKEQLSEVIFTVNGLRHSADTLF